MRILVVEDDADLCELLVLSLRKLGFQVEIAYSGPEALIKFLQAFVRQEPVRAVVLDCAMAPMDGFTVAKTIRLWEANSRALTPCRLGFYTAYAKTVEASTLLEEVRADWYLPKPSDLTELARCVASWLADKS